MLRNKGDRLVLFFAFISKTMKIIALPDLHNNIIGIPLIGQALSKVDLVLLVGDLTNDGPPSDADRLVQVIQRFNPSILAIPGN